MVWNVWGGYRLKKNCDDVADGKNAKTHLCQVMLYAFVPMSKDQND